MRAKYLIRILAGPGWRLFAAAAAAGVLTLVSVLAAHASTTFSVSASSGNDSHPCTAISPRKTITHVLTLAMDGDTIEVAAGRYNTALGETFPLTIDKDLMITGAGPGMTVMDAHGTNRVIMLNSGKTATIWGVTVTGGGMSPAAAASSTIAPSR